MLLTSSFSFLVLLILSSASFGLNIRYINQFITLTLIGCKFINRIYISNKQIENMKFYNTSLAVLLFLSSMCLASVIQGPTVYSLNATPTQVVMSDDGSTIAITYSSQKNVDVFLNNGSTFNVHQSIASTIGSVHAAISGTNSLFLSNGGISKYEKDINGEYQLSLQEQINKQINDIDLCSDEEYVGVGTDTGTYYYSGANFAQKSASVDFSSYVIQKIAYSDDCSWASLILSDNSIRNMKNPFNKQKSLNFATLPTDVAISDSYIIVSFSSQVLLYDIRGWSFHLIQNFTGEAFNVKKIKANSDLSAFVSARTDKIFSLYTLSNEVYTVSFEHLIGAEISGIAFNSDATLFACVSAKDELYVFYKCPDFCLTCSFTSICTVCQSGYYVQDGQCVAGVAPTPANSEVSANQTNQTTNATAQNQTVSNQTSLNQTTSSPVTNVTVSNQTSQNQTSLNQTSSSNETSSNQTTSNNTNQTSINQTSSNHTESNQTANETSSNQTSTSLSVVFCVGNITIKEGICEQFCHEKCESCTDVWTECIECSHFYTRDDEGNCVIQNTALSVVTKVRPLFNLLKGKAFTSLFFAISDLRFYDYHKKEYNGLEKQVFRTIRFVEEKQWELIGLATTKDQIEGSIEFASQYYPESNPTYLVEERKGNLFIESTIDYFVFFLPFTLVTFILFNRIFYCLFNYEISKYLRVYSFWWVMLELLIQKNVELFTFLGFRNFVIMHQYDIQSKMILILNVMVFFITFLTAFCSYLFYYGEYGRLAKYFLINMFRFPSSYALMIIVYGIKPFLKGAIHALLYKQWIIQIWTLLGVELLIILTIFIMEFRNDNHRSKLVFMMDITYSFSLAIFNLLLLLKYEYLAKDEELVNVTEEVLTAIIYFMIWMTLLRLVWELIPWDSLKALVMCEIPDEKDEEEKSEKIKQEKDLKEQKEEQKQKENKLKKEEEQKDVKKVKEVKEKKKSKKKTKKIQKEQKKEKKKSRKKDQTPRQIKNKKLKELNARKKGRNPLVINSNEKKAEEIPTIRLDWKKRG